MNVDTMRRAWVLDAGCRVARVIPVCTMLYALYSMLYAVSWVVQCSSAYAIACMILSYSLLGPSPSTVIYSQLWCAKCRTCTFVAVYYEYAADYFGLQE